MNALQERFAAIQSPGKRGYQEDDYGLLDADGQREHMLILVADGMGGHAGGDTASAIVTENFIEAYQQASGSVTERLQVALDGATAALAAVVGARPELKGMGSTLVAAVITESSIEWLSVGDSPLWLFRDGRLQRLNADHSMTPVLQDMVASGRLTQEQADTDPRRHSLLSAMMGEKPELVDLSPAPLPLRRDDVVLLASDGVLTLPEGAIAQLLAAQSLQPVNALAEALLHAVEHVDLPSQDNITLLLYRAAPPVARVAEPQTRQFAPSRSASLPKVLAVCAALLALAALLFFQLHEEDVELAGAQAGALAPPPTEPAAMTPATPLAEASATVPPGAAPKPDATLDESVVKPLRTDAELRAPKDPSAATESTTNTQAEAPPK